MTPAYPSTGVGELSSIQPPTPEQLRLAMEAAELAFWEWDLVSGQVQLAGEWGRFTRAPGNWARQSIDSLLTQVHPDDLAGVRQSLTAYLRGHTKRYSTVHRVKSGDGWVWLESLGVASARAQDGRILRMVGSNADITSRKAVEHELTLAQARAEQASQTKSEFLANMSHEVRTPLNAIMGLIRLMRQSSLDTQQIEYLGLMDSSATSLLALLNDVLDLSKIEAGKLVFEQVRFDLHNWVDDIVSTFVAHAHEKNLALELEIAPGLPKHVMGDPGRLRQVLANLMSNALKFTLKGGIRLKVWADPNQGDVPDSSTRILFEVRDSGIGISPQQQERIFEAFTQADASTTRRFGGTGLGLAICRRLVVLMGGRIRVASKPGLGSAFRFSAVFGQAPGLLTALTEPSALEAKSLAGLNVLLAEDHPVNQLLMRKLLHEFECKLTIVGNGEDAVNRWKQGGIDLILMDVQMPIMDGDEATRLIRVAEQGTGGHTPIVALTAHALAGDREKYLACGMDAYASKPVSPDTLAHAMHVALESARPANFSPNILGDFDFRLSASTGHP